MSGMADGGGGHEKPPSPKTKGTYGISLGGAEGIRTPDLLNAIQTRSQLRHSPTYSVPMNNQGWLVELRGFEPLTSTVRL